jgi:hypothetical protein
MKNSEKNSREQQKRRPYKRPTMTRVGLVAEQVLAVGCKLDAGSGGPLSPISCTNNNCNTAGS